ncbi:phenylalanyl-tRNA synthetase beta subunit [Balneicella halophila]|uniref:Phenylalanine--tRNA ligase beta subunit n=1 Tax=Balneicella halophila TaxID=1537566 RepID=A0A7L4UNQ1_BALHA|nr:phenylalanine--tRNA ligase subunit beta [Balneicella halophila]PVX49917.1 phenylalanyl-tRNA synthetase beta subunit [Balneicella halophila]
MKIAYSWLKDYIKTDIAPEKIANILTQTGLEVGSIEKIEAIKGGLNGVVVGEVKECMPHPNSDHLNLTKVDVGSGDLLPIVCGAPNVATGQKVMVATVGTIFYDEDKEFVIKKAKLRGEPSEGMICSEAELGVGNDASGIMVLPQEAVIGTPAKEYFNLKDDYAIEIDLTPNRIDGASHIGVARDLAAFLKVHNEPTEYTKPSVADFHEATAMNPVKIVVDSSESCPRYAGISLDNITVKPSPDWLQNRLRTIGLTPINNVVDITNYVLFETGQPLHAFDRVQVGDTIQVKTLPEGTKFITLDGVERELNGEDLMICNSEKPMCIAGVFGGIESGVTDETTSIFLESAYFNPVQVRKTARRHALNTDASFRFERGVDPDITIYALKRATLLLQEITGATISSEIADYYPKKIKGATVTLALSQVERLTGVKIPKQKIIEILKALEITVTENRDDALLLEIPAYRVDVTREADVIEEILRIYGYDNIPVKSQVNSVLSYAKKPDTYQLKNTIGDYLSANGFNEIMNNSLTKSLYYQGIEEVVEGTEVLLKNPLSQDLDSMRRSLVFGGLESIAYNSNRKRSDLKFYEFGKTYHYFHDEDASHPVKNYSEFDKLAIFITGKTTEQSWNVTATVSDFYYLKAYTFNILEKLGINKESIVEEDFSNELYVEGLKLTIGKNIIGYLGQLKKQIVKVADVSQDVFYAEINWEVVLDLIKTHNIVFKPLAKYPEVRRDFALLLDEKITFKEVKKLIKQTERKLLKNIQLFDVYTGDKLPEGKKSYAVAVILQDENATLTDKQIDKVSQKLQRAFEKQLGASLR